MCQERGGRDEFAISTHLIHAWYMKHAFQEFRGTWRCISFIRTKSSKKKSAYQAQADMAKTMNLQRASARAAASRSSSNLGCTESSQWMFRSLNALYTKRKSRAKDHRVGRLQSLIRTTSGLDGVEDPVSSSSLAELIPSCTVDFDLGNIAMSPDSEYHTTGEPPSRRSSDSFLSPKNRDSSGMASVPACPQSSPFRPGKSHRRKRSIFRAAKVALTGGRGNGAAGTRRHVLPVFPITSGIGIGRSRYSLSSTSMKTQSTRMVEKQHPTSPAPPKLEKHFRLEKNLSRGTSVTMDTSSSPCKSSNNTTWMENYDMLTETVSTSSWSLRTDLDSPPRARKLETARDRHVENRPRGRYLDRPLEREADRFESPRGEKFESPRGSKFNREEWRRMVHESDDKQEYWFDERKRPTSPVARPLSRRDFRQRQASAIEGARNTGKDFQEAIVDIILDNDVNDLVDLEEFLQNFYRLNAFYQDIIQQFFNDLSEDLVTPYISRAPSIFARLAAGNQKPTAAMKRGGRRRELVA